ncbi:MAG: hypothetical protein WB795_20270, partial [Candidatus Acidiferrales bacterium]
MIAFATLAAGRKKVFQDWPTGTSPAEIGKRVAERFASGPHTNFGKSAPPEHITYPETVAWYGALTFAQVTGAKKLTAQLVNRFAPLFSVEAALIPEPVHVDATVFGAVPLQIYIETKDPK